MNVAKAIEGIPVVQSTTERGILFPTPATNQRVQNLQTRQFERFDGVQWVTDFPGVITPQLFGAKGDGVADDTAAITAALAAVPAAGGTVFFPPGTYNTTGGHTISNPTLVVGAGNVALDQSAAISQINCTSQTAVVFTVTAKVAKFSDIGFINGFAGVPTAGSAVFVNGLYLAQRVDFENVSVHGFYDNIDVAVGANWTMVSCHSTGWVRYGLRIRNVINKDWGDWTLLGCNFYSRTYNGTAAIRIESSGGGKILGCKINRYDSSLTQYGIQLVGDGSTIILIVNGCSIENVSVRGIYCSGSWPFITISNNEFGMFLNNTSSAIEVTLNSRVIISNNHFQGSATYAVIVSNVAFLTFTPGQQNSGFAGLLSVAAVTHITPNDLFVGPIDPRLAGSALTALGAANRARWQCFTCQLPHAVTSVRLWVGASSGNIDVGIYDSTGAKLGSSGSVACPAGAAGRSVNLSSTVHLIPGETYWAVLAADNNVATFMMNTASVGILRPSNTVLGGFMEAAFPLPATLVSAGENMTDPVLLFE